MKGSQRVNYCTIFKFSKCNCLCNLNGTSHTRGKYLHLRRTWQPTLGCLNKMFLASQWEAILMIPKVEVKFWCIQNTHTCIIVSIFFPQLNAVHCPTRQTRIDLSLFYLTSIFILFLSYEVFLYCSSTHAIPLLLSQLQYRKCWEGSWTFDFMLFISLLYL